MEQSKIIDTLETYQLTVSKEEKTEVDILVIALVALVQNGVNSLDLLEVFLQRRIQPLQARAHPMWEYTRLSETT